MGIEVLFINAWIVEKISLKTACLLICVLFIYGSKRRWVEVSSNDLLSFYAFSVHGQSTLNPSRWFDSYQKSDLCDGLNGLS